LNGDGKVDLLVSGQSSGVFRVLPGIGDGTFGQPLDYVGSGVTAIADFNGDGFNDAFVGGTLFLGRSDGTLSGDRVVVVSNSGNTGVTISSATISGANASDFAVLSSTCGGLNPSDLCYIAIRFQPTAAGSRTASLVIADNTNSSPHSINLTGKGDSATPVVSFTGAPAAAAFGATFTVVATTNASTTAVITASGACSITGNAVTMTSGTGTCSLTANWAADNNYAAASATQMTTATRALPTAAFTGAPASASFGSTFQVAATTNASTTAVIAASGACSITGSTVSITSSTGTCSLTATWASDNNYAAASATQMTTATRALPTATFTGAPVNAPYEGKFTVVATTNASTTAVITASGVCSIAGSTVTMTASAGTCSLTATWAADTNYVAATATQSTTATRATPVITWPTPTAITYGTALSGTQLNATATYNSTTVAGTFVYTPAKGSVLGAGSHTLLVTFTPTNTTNYTGVGASVTLQVSQAAPKITWANPAAITYGTVLSSLQLNATASVPGSFVYSPPAGTVLAAGTQTLSVTFTPTDTTDYSRVSDSVAITINQGVSSTTITSNLPNPSVIGQSVSIRFSVTGNGVPTGTVTVTANSGQSCSGALSTGNGSCVLIFTASGSPKLKASYSGDSNFKPSSSVNVTQTVQP
jgi:hypothetical protein